MRLAFALAATMLAGPTLAQQAAAPFTIVETGEGFRTLDDAVTKIRNDTATIMIAPGTYRDCTVQGAGNITYKAAVPGKVIFDGGTCEGKAAFVLRGTSAVVDGIVFRNMAVDDGNGSGIRHEIGTLVVRNAMFLNSQEGILAGNQPVSIEIDRSTFSGLGRCDQGLSCAHSVYIGNIGSVKITRSRFERGTGGHYVKLRAKRVEITDSSFDDSAGKQTNYMIDLPAGSTGLIARNTFVQGPDKENWTGFIVVAAEDRENSSAGLTVRDNKASLAPGAKKSPSWVADYSGERMDIAGNQLGEGIKAFESR